MTVKELAKRLQKMMDEKPGVGKYPIILEVCNNGVPTRVSANQIDTFVHKKTKCVFLCK
jgi:hypothetical protein